MIARLVVVMGTVVLLVSGGCGSKGKSNAGAGKSQGTKHVEQASLPTLGKEITGLDSGRLSLSAPSNWRVLDKNDKYLAKFSLFKRGETPIPLIVVKADDSPFAELQTVSQDELEDFAISMSEIVREKGGKLLEKVRPMVIGGVPCIRYVKRTLFTFHVPKMQRIDGETQYLTTLAGGRLYTIELRVRKDTIRNHRDLAYAVLASMKFGEAKE